MIDWAALILEVTGVWLVGNHKSVGFFLKACCSIAWIITGVLYKVPGLTVAAGIMFIINARNYFKWKREEKRGSYEKEEWDNRPIHNSKHTEKKEV